MEKSIKTPTNVYKGLVKEEYMALNVKKMKSPSKFPRPPALDEGSYPARVVQIISLGLQKQRPYKGEEKAPKQELLVTYEILDEFMLDEDGKPDEAKPRWISETFALNGLDSDLAKSTKRYMAIDPKLEYEGDWSKLAGVPVTVTLTQDVSKKDDSIVYNNVASVSTMRPKEAAKAPELVNPSKVFDVDDPDMEVFFALPEWLQNRIKENLDYEGSKLEKLVKKGPESSEKKEKQQEASKDEDEDEQDEEDEEGEW